MSLYWWIILGTICGPFFLSFDKKVHFYTNYKYLFPAIILVGIAFLIWDEFFTQKAIWGFNPNYISRSYLGHLPIEEVSFFLVVPYACLFIFEVLASYFSNVNTKKLGQYVAVAFAFSGLVLGVLYYMNWYTASACIASALLTIWFYFIKKVAWFGQFAFTYIVCLIPFLIVNGILTGSLTDEPIVWYSEEHIIGPRIITIPVEDLFYNYSMLLPITSIYMYLKNKGINKKNTL